MEIEEIIECCKKCDNYCHDLKSLLNEQLERIHEGMGERSIEYCNGKVSVEEALGYETARGDLLGLMEELKNE